ncbi:unnamed protein product, partial [Ectocarpus fasciculatus]
MLTGTPLKDGYRLIGLDLDNKTDEKGENGVEGYTNMCDDNNYNLKTNVTVCQQSGNYGYHFLYKVKEDKYHAIKSNKQGLVYKGINYNIDIRGDNGCLYCYPTKYIGKDGEIKRYKIKADCEILEIPEFLYNLLVKPDVKPIKTEMIRENDVVLEQSKPLFYLLNIKRFEEMNSWLQMGAIMKTVGYDASFFHILSKRCKNYEYKACENVYKSKMTNCGNLGIIHHYASLDNPEEYKKLNLKYEHPDDIKDNNVIEINSRYLLEKNDVYLCNDSVLTTNIRKWQTDDIKSLNIKSPYDTGKTTMLKTIMSVFNPKRVLWLSYRKTLTMDILGNFASFGFKDYQKGIYNADRLICQVESLIKINMSLENKIPKYDLVIIDEVESVLNQFNSNTFKGKSKQAFNFMMYIIKASTKIITLDGGMSNKTYDFINNFGTSINIVNKVQFNKKKYIINNDKIEFTNMIDTDIANNLNIVIVSMSASLCQWYQTYISEKYPDKKIRCYTGRTNDKDRNELNNIKETWTDTNILIYSPTIEAGVNYDVENHFNKVYGAICTRSSNYKAFCQMLNRVRKLTDNTIHIYNEGFNHDNIEINKRFKYSYMKCVSMYNLNLEFEDVEYIKDNETYIKTTLSPYNVNDIYNRLDDINSNAYIFLSSFYHTVTNQGHEVINKCTNAKKVKMDEAIDVRLSKLINEAIDIDDIEAETLITKQKTNEATAEDKLSLKKFFIKKRLGLKQLNEDIIYNVTDSALNNYLDIIDERNIKKHDDNYTLERKKRRQVIIQLIHDLGFNNIHDKRKIAKETIEEGLNKNEAFINIKKTCILFHIDNRKVINTIKSKMGLINSLLNSYCLKLVNSQKGNNKNRSNYYNIQKLHNMDEFL